jgi:DNA-binding response OmpR family regulator
VLLVRNALAQHGLQADLTVQRDGEEMFRLLERIDAGETPCPDLVLLDLNLPRRTGLEILDRVRRSPVCAQVPVVMVTSSQAPQDRQAVAELGGNRYFCKPSSYDEFMHLGEVISELLGVGRRGDVGSSES